jgi:hypothetical protein
MIVLGSSPKLSELSGKFVTFELEGGRFKVLEKIGEESKGKELLGNLSVPLAS